MNATDSSPAGGAELGEVFAATGGAIATAILLYLGLGTPHRPHPRFFAASPSAPPRGQRYRLLGGASPHLIATGSLLVALVGMYWDISLHIADGRDAGPFANPAHFLILFGLYGIFAAGLLAIVLPDERPSRGAIRISGDWYAPLGGIAMIASAAFALIGFPLDDVWHRIFGQDVTLFGPTHLMLIGGAALTLIGSAILLVEGREEHGERNWRGKLLQGRRIFAFGGLLIGLSTFQAEFDFGVPQFNLVLEPIMLASRRASPSWARGCGSVRARRSGRRCSSSRFAASSR